MKDKLKDDKFVKDLLYKFLSLLVIAVVALLLLNVMSLKKDGRRQIIDEDGGTEYLNEVFTREELKLTETLKGIKGVGDVRVMLTYELAETADNYFSDGRKDREGRVKGAVVIASGGGKAVTKKNIVEAVTALYNIPVQNVKVFEKSEEVNK